MDFSECLIFHYAMPKSIYKICNNIEHYFNYKHMVYYVHGFSNFGLESGGSDEFYDDLEVQGLFPYCSGQCHFPARPSAHVIVLLRDPSRQSAVRLRGMYLRPIFYQL